MADDREPPTLFDEEENGEIDQDSDDLFNSASENQTKVNLKEEDKDEDEKEDIFADAETEVPLDSPEDDDNPFKEPENANPFGNDDTPKLEVSDSETAKPATVVPSLPTATSVDERKLEKDLSQEEKDEEIDQYNVEITVTEPKKVGDGMGAYMAFRVSTKSTLPQFKRRESVVYRRFSDFLGLHDKLATRYQPEGRIVPPPPEKSVVGMTKIKMAKEDSGSHDFIEKRRAALERFLSRVGKHQVMRVDHDFREFLELDGDLPKSTSTSALSGAGVMRLFNKVGDSFGKIAFKMDETDQWFDEKQSQVEALDIQLTKLHSSIEALVQYRKDLAFNTGQFARSAAMLGNAEEHTSLSRALSQLAEIEEKVDTLHMDQADGDFFVFAELVKDYVSLIGSIKEVFHERVKIYKQWKEAEAMLGKKQEQRAKLEQQRKLDKIPAVSQEITEWENKVEKGQVDFEKISKNIRTEMVQFEKQRVKDFKATIVNYLEALMNNQQQLIKYWEGFIPEAKAIA